MFRADPWHSGVNDDGGTRPASTLRWSFPTGNRVYSSPAVVDGVVFIGSDDKRVYALNASNGAEVWNYTTGGRVLTSPAVENGIVYAGSYDYSLYALNQSSGEKLWSFPTQAWVTSSPVVAYGIVYSGSLWDKLYAIDALTGREIWNASLGKDATIESSPAVAGGIVYVTANETSLFALDAHTGREIWNFYAGMAIQSSPAVVGGCVYVAVLDTRVYALDALTGAQIWNTTIGGQNQMGSSPAVTGGVLYIGGSDNRVHALNTTTGREIWSFTTGNLVTSSPTVANGVVYVGSWDKNMYALDSATGAEIWKFPTDSVIYSSPSIASGLVFFGSLDGKVYAVGSPPDAANLMLGKTGPSFAENASTIHYLLSYRNNGNVAAENVVLRDLLPPSVEYLSGSGSPVYDDPTRTVTWSLGSIAPHATGTQTLTVRIASSAPYGTVLNNTATITTTTQETRVDDNTAWALTEVKAIWCPGGVSIMPSVPTPWGSPSVSWLDQVTFSYNQTICPPNTQVDIRIHINDGGPDITATMTGGPQYWNYSTTFSPRYGPAEVTYGTPGCTITGITFPVYIEPTGYIFEKVTGTRIKGARVWLQLPDEGGNWINVTPGLLPSPMQPDENPLVTGASGQFQWEVVPGSYRVYVEADKFWPAASSMVNSPPPFSQLSLGLEETNPKPVVNFTSSPSSGESPLFVQFTDLSTGEPPLSYQWSFGDGSPISTEKDPVHIYTTTVNRTFSVIHAVTNSAGTVGKIGSITVTAPKTFGANFTANTTSGLIPLTVQFTDLSTSTLSLSYQWNFGDGSMNKTERNPIHTYERLGSYSVTLTVVDKQGKVSSVTKNKYIFTSDPNTLQAEFTAFPVTGPSPLSVQFTDKSSGLPTKFFWTFGDKGTSNEQNPVHVYTRAGAYTVSLKVSNDYRSYTKRVGKMIIVR